MIAPACEWSGSTCLVRAQLKRAALDAASLPPAHPNRWAAMSDAANALAAHHCGPTPEISLEDIDELIDEACKAFRLAHAADDDAHDRPYALIRRDIRRAVQTYREQGKRKLTDYLEMEGR